MIEAIWHILLTVCSSGQCFTQDIQWFESQKECETMLVQYVELPPDGDWDSIQYVCKQKDAIET